jgi:hypothetical protein
MINFDISRDWVIFADPPAMEAAEELARYFGLLRGKAGLSQEQPQINETTAALPDSVPIIILKTGSKNSDSSGFTWKFNNDRIDICGDSLRGLWNGFFDFLSALGFKWPAPGKEELPPAGQESAVFYLNNNNASCPSMPSAQKRRRFFVREKTGAREREELIKWAARNKYDALVFSLKDKSVWARARAGKKISGKYNLVKRYAIMLEAGGCDLSLLISRRLYMFHRELFRMESGKRISANHFCPTNPQTISRITEKARQFFIYTSPGMTIPRVFHLLPDHGFEKTWCACPACRAFSPPEQNLIAVNSAADALVVLDPQALLSCFDFSASEGEPDTCGIKPRENVFLLDNVRN